ncbi:MAG: DUF4118 domain-containing protein [Anaerolineae bacterium]|nr:DUF4118 domain-containing protein [Anaerolineae bacterium]
MAFLCFNFFFIEPRLSLLVSSTTDSLVLAFFLGVALVISRLLGRARRNAIQAEQREHDAARFYELSLALISTRDPGDIAATLANRLHGILSGPVEVTLRPDPFAGETALVLERLRASRAETRAAVLEESDRLKTALLGSVSHELRTPLATIRAGAERPAQRPRRAESSAGRKSWMMCATLPND